MSKFKFGFMSKKQVDKLNIRKWDSVTYDDVGKVVLFKIEDCKDVIYGTIRIDVPYSDFIIIDLDGEPWSNIDTFAEDIYNIKQQFDGEL